jgi:hypothetical protein
MKVFVQNNQVAANTGPLARAARSAGIELDDVSFPWGSPPPPPVGRTFSYGSVAFVKALRSLPGWGEQIAWTKDAFCAAKWRDVYGERYVGARGKAMPTAEVAGALPAAVRPLYGDKAFPGGVYSPATWVQPASPAEAWVAPVVAIEREVRLWIVGGSPIAAGQYRPNVEPFDSLALPTLGDLPLDDIVADFALTPDGWKLLEFNCIHTAGFYAIDPADLLRALQRCP